MHYAIFLCRFNRDRGNSNSDFGRNNNNNRGSRGDGPPRGGLGGGSRNDGPPRGGMGGGGNAFRR